MNIGDRVRISSGDFQGKSGKIKARHFNPVLSEMKKIKAGVTISDIGTETLYSVRINGEKDNIYFPENCLELTSD